MTSVHTGISQEIDALTVSSQTDMFEEMEGVADQQLLGHYADEFSDHRKFIHHLIDQLSTPKKTLARR